MVKSDEPQRPERFLAGFAELSERSPAPDGDPQADGWGISWLEAGGCWKTRKFLAAVWESDHLFSGFPESAFFCIHARSASSPDLKNILAFNQPFIDGRFAFVFNGFLQGISLPYPVPGEIGSQKIWALLHSLLESAGPPESLEELKALLNRRARRVQALNIGLCDGENLYGLCQYAEHEGYYRCWDHVSQGLRMICSGPLDGFDFRPAPRNSVFVL